jgi:hypothetical protein
VSAVERAVEIVPCTCDRAYTDRRLIDPNCHGCTVREIVEQLADEGHVVTDEMRAVLDELRKFCIHTTGDTIYINCGPFRLADGTQTPYAARIFHGHPNAWVDHEAAAIAIGAFERAVDAWLAAEE